MNTLIVKYLPSGAHSQTKKVLNVFLEELGNKPVETLDLLQQKVPNFSEASLAAYVKRNYMSQSLSAQEAALLKDNDQLIKQFKSADIVVMAYPMHNFGMPGIVKSYFDAIMFNGETFLKSGKAMPGKKALTLFTSGGSYGQGKVDLEYPNWDTLTMNAKINFKFMGFDDAEVLSTTLRDPNVEKENLEKIKKSIQEIVKKWYR